MTEPKLPAGLRSRGKKFWLTVNADLELEVHELELLGEACRTLDRLDSLDRSVRKDGAVGKDGKVSPALVEARHQQITLARVLAALRLPDDFAEADHRPQRRAARGVYRKPTPLRREA